MATNGINHQEQYGAAATPAAASPAAAPGSPGTTSGHSKDEVGWFFVEQYYTTMSKNPNKLHVSKTNW